MVSTRKIKYYVDRIDYMIREKRTQVSKTYEDKSLHLRNLISDGHGTMKTESEIRKAISNTSPYACPPCVELQHLFIFDGERNQLKIENDVLSKIRIQKNTELDTLKKEAIDLAYLGTESQMLAKLKEVEEYKI